MRRGVESVLRALGIGALLLALWQAWRPARESVAQEVARVRLVPADSLARLLTDPVRSELALDLPSVPDGETRALLQAATHAGVRVAWRSADGSPLPALAVSAEARVDPAGGSVVRLAAPSNASVELADSLGWIDSATVTAPGVTWQVPGEPRAFAVRLGGTIARTSEPRAAAPRRVRLLAEAGWDARFTLLALEEAGWTVDAAFAIAPRVRVNAGQPESLDTARYAAVVALDSSAWSQASAIARFVRDGGGLVLLSDAADGAPAVLPRAGAVGTRTEGVPGALRTAAPREGLAFHPFARLEPESVVLERSTRAGAPPSVVARRIEAGRVVQVAWGSTWEWRMLGDDASLDAHRDWWRLLLQRAAAGGDSVPVVEGPWPGDAAPLADLVARVGAPGSSSGRVPDGAADAGSTSRPPDPRLLLLAAAALLAEWWSRRLRGAR
jgi:hypothetical protein